MSDTFRVIEHLKSDFFRVKKSIMSKILQSVTDYNQKNKEKITIGLVKVVYVSMAEFANNQDQKLFPSHKRLIEMTGMSKPSIIKAIDFLCQYGYIHKTSNRRGENNIYHLTEPDLSQEGTTGSDFTPPEFPGDTDTPGNDLPKNQVNEATNKSTGPAPTDKSGSGRILQKPEEVPDELWKEFILHRKMKRSAISDLVIKKYREEARKAGISLSEAIEESIFRGWQGFKAEWYLGDKFKKPLSERIEIVKNI